MTHASHFQSYKVVFEHCVKNRLKYCRLQLFVRFEYMPVYIFHIMIGYETHNQECLASLL